MDTNIHKKGLVNALLVLALGITTAVLASAANSATGVVSSVFLGVGFLVAGVCYFQMRLEERERLEALDSQEVKKGVPGAALFAQEQGDMFPARRSREQFERYVVPGFSIVLLLLQAGAVYGLWSFKVLQEDKPAGVTQATLAMALFGMLSLVFFQFGKYSAVLARLEGLRLLRPQASYLLLGAVLSFVTAGVEVAVWAGYPSVDLITARVLTALLVLAAAENLMALVFEIYRPRVRGVAEHPLYESRLVGLLSQPGGLITTAAQALDYQFGFKVSETWFYRFLERALAWLILLQIGILFVSSMFVIIEPGEKALLERFGRPVVGREVLDSGPHVKWPWPIDKVYRFDTEKIQQFRVGLVQDEAMEKQRTLLWTRSHAKEEFNMVVASRSQIEDRDLGSDQTVPVNLLSVDIPVQYQVKDLKAFAYTHENAGETLERVAGSEVTRYLVSVDLIDIMGPGRQKAAAELMSRIQARADAMGLGVNILFVGLHSIHPPVKAAPDFEKVIGAIQDKEATNLYARAYAAERVPQAKAEAVRTVNEAETRRLRQTSAALADAARFTNQLTAYNASPDVYRWRTYMDTVSRSIAPVRKYVIGAPYARSVVTLNLEDKIRPDLSDVMLPSATKK